MWYQLKTVKKFAKISCINVTFCIYIGSKPCCSAVVLYLLLGPECIGHVAIAASRSAANNLRGSSYLHIADASRKTELYSVSDGSEAQHWELLRIFPYHKQDRLLFFSFQIISLKMFESTNVPPTAVFVDCCVKITREMGAEPGDNR